MSDKPKIICLFGPTASGKTDLAMALATQFPVEIISVDSAMVYRGMDIGTAKPTTSELGRVPHRLIDICDPAESYSAGQFCLDAHREIESIFILGKIPLLVGGTMLYFHLLQKGFGQFPESDSRCRAEIDEQAQQPGWPAMHQLLAEIDPDMASQIHKNDAQRIQRALEVFRATGKTMTQWQREQEWIELPFDVINIIVAPHDRVLLHDKIARRFDTMLARGLISEAKALYDRGDLTATMPSMRMVGYRQLWQYFCGDYDKETMRERAIIATRQFAKRQYTWLNKWPDVRRFDTNETDRVFAWLDKVF